ncbi:MAG: type pilus assembly protein PilW [Pseudomonadota bacterium]|nr:type pilus assembly protein PilW [Pseudomonadota bacterium]
MLPLPSMPRPARARGVTLIELMIGMVIGLLVVLVISQTALLFENRKRAITSGSDAQVSGALALMTMQRELQDSGYGLADGGAIGCPVRAHHSSMAAGALLRFTLAPAVITDGAAGAPDRIAIVLSKPTNAAVPLRVISDHTRDASAFSVNTGSGLGLSQGDLMLAVPATVPDPQALASSETSWCSVFNLSATPATDSTTLVHASDANGPWNPDAASTVLFPGTTSTSVAYGTGSVLLNLGTLTRRTYCISGLGDDCDSGGSPLVPLNLRQISFSSSTAKESVEDLYPQVVQLQAVYGIDSSGNDRIVDQWTATAPTTAAGWRQVIAVRIAVATRSVQDERRPDLNSTQVVTSELPVWHPDGSTAESLRVDLTVGSQWQNYRYRVYEMVVPLRNMLWQAAS